MVPTPGAGSGILKDMKTGGRPDCGVCAAVDVHYLSTGGARAAAVLATDAAFAHALAEPTAVAPYRLGEFYLRELPLLRVVLEDLSGLGLLVVDGCADLDPAGRPGLGARAHAEFGIPVIGVTKSRFRAATHAVPVVRGSSVRPLFVTSAGMPAADAADLVRRMAGRYRLPDPLRRADTLARTGPPAVTMTSCQPDRPTQTRGTPHERTLLRGPMAPDG
jgi:deoxyribonuclease V